MPANSNDQWDARRAVDVSSFPSLLYRDRYQAVGRFLLDRDAVNRGLDALQTASQGQNVASFGTWLTSEEVRFGLSADVKTIGSGDRLVKASMFWTYLFARRPLTDLGAGPLHGAWTHRIQWVLIGRWNEATGSLGDRRAIGELYGNLGAGNARTLKPDRRAAIEAGQERIDTGRSNPLLSAWDNLVDSLSAVSNATYPEFLCWHIKSAYPALSARLMG